MSQSGERKRATGVVLMLIPHEYNSRLEILSLLPVDPLCEWTDECVRLARATGNATAIARTEHMALQALRAAARRAAMSAAETFTADDVQALVLARVDVKVCAGLAAKYALDAVAVSRGGDPSDISYSIRPKRKIVGARYRVYADEFRCECRILFEDFFADFECLAGDGDDEGTYWPGQNLFVVRNFSYRAMNVNDVWNILEFLVCSPDH